MANANVDLVRSVYDAFGRGEPAHELLDPDVVWHQASDLPDGQVVRGREAVGAMAAEWSESFDDFRADIAEFIDHGEHVVVPLVLRGRLRGSPDEVALPETHVWTLRDGAMVEVREYRTTEAALESLGRQAQGRA